MTCDQYKTILAAESYGDNTPEERGLLMAHLETCSSCRALASELRDLSARLPPTLGAFSVDDGFWIRQKASILERLPERRALLHWAWARIAAPVLALSVVISAWNSHQRAARLDMHIAQQMDLLQNMEMLQQLDVVENLDTMENQ